MTSRTLSLVLAAVAVLTMIVAASPAAAQEAWPSRPIRLVTPSPAGVGSDAFARLYAEHLGKALGVTVFVENKPGASGILGTDAAAKAAPDGYTLLFSTSLPLTVAPHLFPRLPYEPASDFVPVAPLYRGGSFVIAGSAFTGNSIKDVVRQAKDKPDSVTYASYGSGGTAHLAMEQFQEVAGVQLLHIPYKQSAVNDVAGGQVTIGFEPPVSTLPYIKSGRVKALAYTGDRRSTMLPDVPTLAELYPGFEIFTWVGIWAPQGTPAPILRRLQDAIAAATKLPEIQKALADVGNEPMSGTPAQMEALTLQESDRMSRLIKAKNITVN